MQKSLQRIFATFYVVRSFLTVYFCNGLLCAVFFDYLFLQRFYLCAVFLTIYFDFESFIFAYLIKYSKKHCTNLNDFLFISKQKNAFFVWFARHRKKNASTVLGKLEEIKQPRVEH